MSSVSQLYGQIRTGRVSSVDKKRHTAQVKFDEIDGFVSWDLQVLVTRPGDYSLPVENTPVLCLLVDGRLGVGYVLGAIYTESDAAPLDDDGKRSIAGNDIRLGDPDASDKVALAPKVNDNFSAFWDVIDSVFGAESLPIVTTAPSAPDAVYVAMKAAIAAKQLTNALPPADVAAEKVSAK